MQYADFEKHAKNTFALDVEYVDTEQLLANLSLEQKPKRKSPILWLFAALLGLGTLGTLAFWYSSTDQLSTSPSIALSTSTGLDEMANTGSSVLNENEDVYDPLANKEINPLSKEEEVTDASYLSEKTNTAAKASISSESNLSNSATANKFTSDEISKTPNSEITTSKSAILSSATTSISKTTPVLTLSESREEISVGQVRRLTPELLKALDRDLPLGDPIQCPSFKEGRGFHFDLIPEVGLMYPYKSLNDESSESSLIAALRSDEEEALEGLQIALYGRMSMDKSPFYLKAGLSYTRISERMALEYDYIELDTTIGIISISSNPAGDTITTVMGPIVTETQITGNTTRHYYLHQWDMPIALGYERPLGSYTVGIEGGLHLNLRTSVTGNILNTLDTFREAERGVDVKRRVGLGYFGGVHVGRYIPGFGDVYLAARARFVPDVSADAAQTKQNYMLYGLHAGYVYRF
jgi:hypothetical protein